MSAPPPNLLELRRGSTLSSLVAQEITRLIVDGTIPKGARLNESELAARFGVSRGPVREALRTIESDGLVVGIANRGVFVRDIDDRAASEIYDLRAALFAMAGWIVAPIAPPCRRPSPPATWTATTPPTSLSTKPSSTPPAIVA
jgi:DNA-binding GntR family transcriptional regulator